GAAHAGAGGRTMRECVCSASAGRFADVLAPQGRLQALTYLLDLTRDTLSPDVRGTAAVEARLFDLGSAPRVRLAERRRGARLSPALAVVLVGAVREHRRAASHPAGHRHHPRLRWHPRRPAVGVGTARGPAVVRAVVRATLRRAVWSRFHRATDDASRSARVGQ
ncbi:MAG: hypothetical protein ACJATT_003224, partial [Myxococcota bacterium]